MKFFSCKFLPSLFKTTNLPKTYTSSCRVRHNYQKAHGRVHNAELPAVECGIIDFSNAMHDVVSATSFISRFAKQNNHKESIHLFKKTLEVNIKPNEFTFGTVIHSSTVLKDLTLGQQLHSCAKKIGLCSHVFVGSALLDLYVKLSTFEEVKRVFEETHKPNVVSYATLIHAYLKDENFDEAMRLFRTMPEKNVICWNTMISGYSQTGHNEEAVNLFGEMLRERVVPSQSSFPCAIIAASNIAALGMGKSFHACAVKFLGELSLFIGNALITFYAKCGTLEDSFLVFHKLRAKNVVSWNAIICGCAQNGKGKEAVDLFERMKYNGICPNSVTLLGLLWACNHAGLVDEGYSYFCRARLEDDITLKAEHYACMVDLLSRSGRFQEAEKFIHDLPFDPGIGFWKALLGGCQIHANVKLGEFAARKILLLDPDDVSSYVMLSNAHSAAGRWRDVSLMRHEMREKGLARVPGCSWIEIKSKIHVFVRGDRRHSKKDEIYAILRFFLEHVMEGHHTELLSES